MSLRKIYLVAAVFAVYGIYNVWLVVEYGQPLFLSWSAACFIAAVGLWLKKPWSRFVVYAVCLLTIIGWLFFVGVMVWNGWPYAGLAQTIVALLPGVLLIALCIWFMLITFRFFRAAINAHS